MQDNYFISSNIARQECSKLTEKNSMQLYLWEIYTFFKGKIGGLDN